jgi:ABC-type nitrate/sulfonate/bicarbonate transport system substrate-binding protein
MGPSLTVPGPGRSLQSPDGHTRRAFLIRSGQLAVMGAALASGVGRAKVAGAASQATIGLSNIACNAATYAALRQGFFKDEGLDVQVLDTTETAIGPIPALASGRIDAGTATLWSTIPPRLVPGRSLGDIVVTAPIQRGCIALSVLADSDVQSLADLRGAKIAGGEFLFGSALVDAGVDPNTEITWFPAPGAAEAFSVLQSGEFAAVQSADGQGALLEAVRAARMLVVNNSPPASGNYCCGVIMNASSVRGDTPRAAAITRAMMRGAAWAEANRSDIASDMRGSMTMPAQREITQEDMEAALEMQAFVPMAEAARPVLIAQFADYLRYGLPVDGPMDATTLVGRFFMPITDEVVA